MITALVPITPAAPARFSTTNCWPHRSLRCCASMRAMTSMPPPAATDTTMRTRGPDSPPWPAQRRRPARGRPTEQVKHAHRHGLREMLRGRHRLSEGHRLVEPPGPTLPQRRAQTIGSRRQLWLGATSESHRERQGMASMEFGIFDHLDRSDLPLDRLLRGPPQDRRSLRPGRLLRLSPGRASLRRRSAWRRRPACSCRGRAAHAPAALRPAGLRAAAAPSAAADRGDLHARSPERRPARHRLRPRLLADRARLLRRGSGGRAGDLCRRPRARSCRA